jgi:hypothetical protein
VKVHSQEQHFVEIFLQRVEACLIFKGSKQSWLFWPFLCVNIEMLNRCPTGEQMICSTILD